ncbi:MAG: xanthine dehydrogenase family protein subunit M [Candidatus Solibacter sp.]
MKNCTYSRAATAPEAISLIATHSQAKFLGGGTNLIDLMRENIEQPDALIDVTRLGLSGIEETAEGGVRIGAEVRNTAVANHPLVRQRYPVLSQAILFGASGQIRNMATVGGNLMQRTRCYYFYDQASRCNKRDPGSGCDAIEGFNRIHAILGTSEHCIATHPSDMCVALAALGATIYVDGADGPRAIPFDDFHKLPADTPHIETALRPGELITAVELAPLPFASRSLYRKVRDRASYAFALVSVAAALEIEGGRIGNARLALGGVAPKPWRAFEAERVLAGAEANQESFLRAAEAELAGASGYRDNRFKIELAKRTIASVLNELARQEAKQ